MVAHENLDHNRSNFFVIRMLDQGQCVNADEMFYSSKSQFWEKKRSSFHWSWEISVSCTSQEYDKVTTLCYYPFFAPSSVKRSLTDGYKRKEISNFQLKKVVAVAVAYERWPLNWQEVPNIAIWRLENCGILENWSLRRGGGLREVVATGGSTVVII